MVPGPGLSTLPTSSSPMWPVTSSAFMSTPVRSSAGGLASRAIKPSSRMASAASWRPSIDSILHASWMYADTVGETPNFLPQDGVGAIATELEIAAEDGVPRRGAEHGRPPLGGH